MASLSEVKQRLSAVWGKESDNAETYEFDFSADKWTCTRTNAIGPSRFKLSYDDAAARLWWGQSYFMEPDDLKKVPSRIVWYRAADKAKKKGAFVWKKLRDVKLKEPPAQSKPKAKAQPSVQASSVAQKWQPKAQPKQPQASRLVATPKKPQTKSSEMETAGKSLPSGPPSASVVRGGGAKGWPMPEIIFDLKELAVIYKPPYWKCELPDKDADESQSPSLNEVVKRGPKDALILLRWIKERVPGIHESLFKEDFNPALSGTGFGPLAHRIDQETSGLLLVAKSSAAQRHLKTQFYKTEVSKRYVCLVHGVMKTREGVVDASIRTVRTDYSTRSEVSSSGEWASTRYEVIATYAASHHKSAASRRPPGYSLLACDIQTGRTHQIRVHMEHLGHPLVADDKYQAKDEVAEDRAWCARLFLHSYRLRFRDLQNEDVVLTCPLPIDLKSALTSLGIADGAGDFSDLMFGDTSWQRDIFRPDQSKWRPSSRIERKLVEMLIHENNKPIRLDELNSNPEFRQLLQEEGVSGIGKSWLYKHWDLFEVVEDQQTDDLHITLRIFESGDMSEENELERQIDAVQSELENLVRQKQRAVAEEEYQVAADLKRRVEVVTQELSSLRSLRSKALAQPRSGAPDHADDDSHAATKGDNVEREEQVKNIQARRKKPEAFAQDVKDESLFPSLGPPKAAAFPLLGASSAKRGLSADRAIRPGSAVGVPAAAVRSASVGATAATTAAVATDAAPGNTAEEVDAGPPDLRQAIIDFLQKREGFVAHMNEINNDKKLRQVMKEQHPKPMAAVNKKWLEQHEDVFAVLHSKEGEMYIGLEKKARPNSAAGSRSASVDRRKQEQAQSPAYHQVIQQSLEEHAPPLVYSYSSAARKDNAPEPEKDGTAEWAELFLDVLRRSPEKSCSIDALLEAVPLFARGIGSRKLNEQRELLIIFLQGCSSSFKLEKKGFGPDRKYYASAK